MSVDNKFLVRDKITLKVTGLGSSGEGVGKTDGFTVFAHGALADETEEVIEEEIRKQFKMKGLILADIEVMKMQDNNLKEGVTSKILPAGISAKGEISKRDTNGVNQEEFKILQKYIKRIIKQIGEEILQGKIDLKPTGYKYKEKMLPGLCQYGKIVGRGGKRIKNGEGSREIRKKMSGNFIYQWK